MRPLPLLPPAVLAALGTGQLLRGHGLWFDELYTAAVVSRPLGELPGLVVDGRGPTPWLTSPPSFNGPYYLLAALWVRLPLVEADALGLRGLSLLAGVLAVAVLVRAVTQLTTERVAVVAGLLAACSPLLLVQVVEARPYGVALLATSLAVLGVARADLRLFGAAGAAMGLLHWFALPALAGLAVGWAVTSRRRAPLVVAAVAALPALGLVALALGNGAEGGGYLDPTGLAVPWQALSAWTGGGLLLAATVAAVALGARAGFGRPWLLWGWLAVPLAAVTAADLVRPVYVPRYLLPALLALAVLAALGAAQRRWLLALLLVGAVVADARALTRPRWERADQVAAYLLAQQREGEPVVAVEGRSGAGLDHYLRGTRLERDLRLPPDDPPPGATRVWLVRQLAEDGATVPSDDDEILATAGLRVTRTELFRAVKTDLAVQLWERGAAAS